MTDVNYNTKVKPAALKALLWQMKFAGNIDVKAGTLMKY